MSFVHKAQGTAYVSLNVGWMNIWFRTSTPLSRRADGLSPQESISLKLSNSRFLWIHAREISHRNLDIICSDLCIIFGVILLNINVSKITLVFVLLENTPSHWENGLNPRNSSSLSSVCQGQCKGSQGSMTPVQEKPTIESARKDMLIIMAYIIIGNLITKNHRGWWLLADGESESSNEWDLLMVVTWLLHFD